MIKIKMLLSNMFYTIATHPVRLPGFDCHLSPWKPLFCIQISAVKDALLLCLFLGVVVNLCCTLNLANCLEGNVGAILDTLVCLPCLAGGDLLRYCWLSHLQSCTVQHGSLPLVYIRMRRCRAGIDHQWMQVLDIVAFIVSDSQVLICQHDWPTAYLHLTTSMSCNT